MLSFWMVTAWACLPSPGCLLPIAGLLRQLSQVGVQVPAPHHTEVLDPRLLAWLLEPHLLQASTGIRPVGRVLFTFKIAHGKGASHGNSLHPFVALCCTESLSALSCLQCAARRDCSVGASNLSI